MEEKKFFEEPSVTKVEFEFNETVAASGCLESAGYANYSNPDCMS